MTCQNASGMEAIASTSNLEQTVIFIVSTFDVVC